MIILGVPDQVREVVLQKAALRLYVASLELSSPEAQEMVFRIRGICRVGDREGPALRVATGVRTTDPLGSRLRC